MFERLGDLAGVQAGEAASQAFVQTGQAEYERNLRAQLETENHAALATAVEIGDRLAIPSLIEKLEGTLAKQPGKENLALTTQRHLWTPYVPSMRHYTAPAASTPRESEVRAIDLWTIRSQAQQKSIPGIAILIYQRSGSYSSEPVQLAVTPLKVKLPDKKGYSEKVDLDKLLLQESAMALAFKDVDLESPLEGRDAENLAKLDATLRYFIQQFYSLSGFWDEYLGIDTSRPQRYPDVPPSDIRWHSRIIDRSREDIRTTIAAKIREVGIDPDELQPGVHQSSKILPIINKLLKPKRTETTTSWFGFKTVTTEHPAGKIARRAIDAPVDSYGFWDSELQRQTLAEQIERVLLG